MNKYNCILTSIVTALTITCLSAPVNAALITYTYTGNQFDSITTPPSSNMVPLYSFSHVSIEFTIDSSLVPKNGHFDMPLSNPLVTNLPITNFLINDGNFSITADPVNTLLGYSILGVSFDTDADGNVAGRWDISAFELFRSNSIKIESIFNNSPSLNSDISTAVTYPVARYPLTTDAHINNNPGIWTSSIVAVPLPGALLLFVTALIGLRFTGHLSPCRKYNQDSVFR
jgi:hypothetical protein